MRLALLVSLIAASGCEGRIGEVVGGGPGDPRSPGRPDPNNPDPNTPNDPNNPNPTPAAPRFPCDPAQARTTSPTPLRRLSNLQYQNTLQALFPEVIGFQPLTVAQAAINDLPPDDAGSTFKGMDTRLSDRHAQVYYDVADTLATALTTQDQALTQLATACALAASPAAPCVDDFLQSFGARVYRRPLSTEELDRYRALNDGSRDGRELFRSLIFSLLLSPQLLYQVEVDGADDAGTLNLSAHELAARLSYHFWQGPPDQALLAAATDGSLLSAEGYRSQVQRLLADPRTEATIRSFYREWFQLGSITNFRRSPGFDAFAAGIGVDDPEADHLAAAALEIEDLAHHYTFETTGTFRDLLRTDLSFTRSPYLAALYGVEPWDGVSEGVHLPASERAGILTRVAFLATGTHQTHPIHRGAVVRRRLLCTTLTAPSPSELPPGSLVPPPVDPTQTTRQRFANKVINEPCATCHTQMNPIGYVLERYDALGRFRATERIYDDATGELLNELPIDSRSAPRIGRDQSLELDTGAALSQVVAESGLTEPCFARQYFRFTHRRQEAPADNCALESVRAALADGDLRQALAAIALDPSFKTRKVE